VRRGFAISATRDLDLAAAVAREVEPLGYATVWTNDTPAADGLDVAGAMLGATRRIRVAVGVVPCDRRPPHEIAPRISSLDLARLVLGIGAGLAPHPTRIVRETVTLLRHRFGISLSLGVGAMGPAMCVTAGEIADVVMLNWMTPQRIGLARQRIDEGSRRRAPDLRPVEVTAYVRVAIGPRAHERIASEAAHYAKLPHYRRNFETVGKPLASVGIALDGEADASAGLAPYDAVLNETVVRALPAAPDLDEILAIARRAAPPQAD
jgi:alkanesulfonate monooxygenase SsuD/methylene tetrahydromethanopterin reductase-like flavin-dependent oxidoreductase (luciferase family)